jgi:hypothetical protein
MTAMRVATPTAADERTTLDAFLDDARDSVRKKCEGLTVTGERRVTLPTAATALAGIISHLRWLEATWFEVALRGEKNSARRAGPLSDVSLEQLLDDYDVQCQRSRDICRTLSLDTAVYDAGVRFSVRWILFHVLSETAQQLGRIDAVCEPSDGGV